MAVDKIPVIEGGTTPVRSKFLPFGRPQITEEDIKITADIMRTGWLSTGNRTKEFEIVFMEYLRKYGEGLALNSCTAALHLALECLDLQPGDEVITTDMTFAATANTIIHAGGKPVLVDCDRDTCNITLEAIQQAVTPKTRAVIIVHFAGLVIQEDIWTWCRKNNLKLIEDRAHAIEASGNHGVGDFMCFSFYGTKNMTTAIGEGGFLYCKDKEDGARARMLSLHGMSKNAAMRYSKDGFKHYEILDAGFKYNMTDVAAGVALNQLRRIKPNWDRRRSVWHTYCAALSNLPLVMPYNPPAKTYTSSMFCCEAGHTPIKYEWVDHAYHLFAVKLKLEQLRVDRDKVLDALTKEGIGCGVHYMALHTHPFYQKMGYDKDQFPNAQWISERTLSLPFDAALTDADVQDVIKAVKKVLTFYEV